MLDARNDYDSVPCLSCSGEGHHGWRRDGSQRDCNECLGTGRVEDQCHWCLACGAVEELRGKVSCAECLARHARSSAVRRLVHTGVRGVLSEAAVEPLLEVSIAVLGAAAE